MWVVNQIDMVTWHELTNLHKVLDSNLQSFIHTVNCFGYIV